MKVLAYVNHYYGPSLDFVGKSQTSPPRVRGGCLVETIQALRALGARVQVCGIAHHALMLLDEKFSPADPRLLVYESLARMASHVDEYDYFVNVEDDIAIPLATFERVLAFDRSLVFAPGEILHPNRLEKREGGERVCVDLEVEPLAPVWNLDAPTLDFAGHRFRPALNPHSGLLIFSQAKLRRAMKLVDPAFRGHVTGELMPSAFAHWHRPFTLYRSFDDVAFHAVEHLDNWERRQVHRTHHPAGDRHA